MKDELVYFVLFGIVCLFVGSVWGFGSSKEQVAEQCKRQGSFYVGKDDFKCEVAK
jgi:hypothetical protein